MLPITRLIRCSQKTIQGVCFFALSLINISTKTSYLLHSLQVIYSEYDKKRIAEKKEKTKLGGTPQGKLRTKEGKNLPKGRKAKETKEKLTASFRVFKDLFASSMNLLKNLLPEALLYV